VRKFFLFMSRNPPRSLRLRKLLFVAVLVLICVLVIYWLSQENKPWVVPPEYKSLKNPLPPSESNLKAARQIYFDECAQCHGDAGKGDGPEARSHYPLPADLTDPKLLTNVPDGEIFYQISEGRRPMPSFKNRLTEDERWQLVLLVRSFSQPAASGNDPAAASSLPKAPSKSLDGK
jgi:mono/diheme cytochrome c family protein